MVGLRPGRPARFVLSLTLATAGAVQSPSAYSQTQPSPGGSSSLGDQIAQHEQKMNQARATRNLKDETSELVAIGALHQQAGETQKAQECFNQALQIWRKAGSRNGEALALNDIGRAYADLRLEQKALELYNQALPIWRETGNRRGEALTLNH